MGEIISWNDISTMNLTPMGKLKLLEWWRMNQLREAYVASLKAELSQKEREMDDE